VLSPPIPSVLRFEKAIAAGIPFTPTDGGWWDLPGPVRDHLAGLAAADSEALHRAAREYGRRGEPGEAAGLLLSVGEPFEAAALLAAAPPEVIESMDVLELGSIFDQLPRDAVDGNPYLLIAFARSLRTATRFDRSRELAERAATAADGGVAEVWIDPGIGFAKTPAQSAVLLQRLALFANLGLPVLVGLSRKRFLAALTGEEAARARGPASLAGALFALARGAGILRVHDVAETVQAVRVWHGLSLGAPAAA